MMMYAPDRFENVDQVKTHLAHMGARGASYTLILEALHDVFVGEAGISCGDDRRLRYENAANGVADAIAEMDE